MTTFAKISEIKKMAEEGDMAKGTCRCQKKIQRGDVI